MEKPIFSSDFTIEDIHKIRERNYEKARYMSVKEDGAAWIANMAEDISQKLENGEWEKVLSTAWIQKKK